MVLDDPANAFFRPVRIPAQPQIFIDENNVQFGPQGLAFYDGKYIAGSIRRAAVPALTGPGARDVGFIFLVITTFQKSVVGRNGLPDSFECFVQIFNNLVSSDDNDGQWMAPKHSGHAVTRRVDVYQPAILGKGIGSCDKNIAHGSLPAGLFRVFIGRFGCRFDIMGRKGIQDGCLSFFQPIKQANPSNCARITQSDDCFGGYEIKGNIAGLTEIGGEIALDMAGTQ
jgi:hypothetical protein